MSTEPEYAPIEPSPRVDPIGARLVAELQSAPMRLRILLPVYLVISALGGLLGGYALTSAYSTWWTWAVSLLILEPIGIASVLALAVMVSPRSRFSSLLAGALKRAQFAAILVGALLAGFVAWALIYISFELAGAR